MSQHTPPPRTARTSHRSLPRVRSKLLAFELTVDLAGRIAALSLPRGTSHLRVHLERASDNTALRLSEASGRTLGNRYQHLEAACAEYQEVQGDLVLLRVRGFDVPDSITRDADRLGGLVYWRLHSEVRGG